MHMLVMFLTLLSISYSVHADTLKLNFIDYTNKKYPIELKRENGIAELTMTDFTNPNIVLTAVKDKTGVVDGAYDSGMLEQDVRSKTDPSFAIDSFRLALKEGKLVAENQKSTDKLRGILNNMFKEGLIEFSGDVLCPVDSIGFIFVAIKDAFSYPFCITSR